MAIVRASPATARGDVSLLAVGPSLPPGHCGVSLLAVGPSRAVDRSTWSPLAIVASRQVGGRALSLLAIAPSLRLALGRHRGHRHRRTAARRRRSAPQR